MKELKLNIQIDRSVADVFEFCTNPENTPKWVDYIVKEETNEWPVGRGSIYTNSNREEFSSVYIVDEFEKDKIFTLTSEDGNYHVKYTFSPVGDRSCSMEYHEWVDENELTEPFSIKFLENLKSVLEKE